MFTSSRTNTIVRRVMALALCMFSLTGCASTSGPEVMTVSAADYDRTFDAAVEAARRDGLIAVLRDRRSGVIDTEPNNAGTLLEPWRTDNATFDQALGNTVAQQRRRARFEFAPADRMQQPDLPQSPIIAPPQPDLTESDGTLELRVWVYVERAHTPGLRPGIWSRRNRTIAQRIERDPGESGPPVAAAPYWTVVGRDIAYERRLLAAVQDLTR